MGRQFGAMRRVHVMRTSSTLSGAMAAAVRGSRGYLQVLAVVSGARLFGLASQFVVLVLLSRIMPKDSFGDLMTAFGFYRLAGIALGVGPSLLLLYHVSRRSHDRDAEVRLHRYSAILGALVSGIVALSGVLAAGPIAKMLDKPGLAVWFEVLAPFAVFSTLLVIATGALEGRSRINESIVLNEVVPNAIRIVLLPVVALCALPDAAIAHVLTLSVLLPWLWAARRMWNRSIAGIAPWTRWDYGYSGKFVVATLFANQLGAVDILVAGALFSSETVADYAVASRVAALYSFFQLALLKRFAPRAGHLQEIGDLGALRREVELCRRLTIACTALTICGILLLAPYILPLFGSYMGAEAMLVWIAIATLIQSFYATSDRLLITAGQANVALVLTGSTFLVLVTTPFVTAAWLGILAIPAAMVAAQIVFQPIVAIGVRKHFSIRTIAPIDVAMMVCGGLAIALHATNRSLFSALSAGAVLAAIGLFYIVPAMLQARTAESAPATSS
jgi:O-antigen/teichoic acid export membrane protein